MEYPSDNENCGENYCSFILHQIIIHLSLSSTVLVPVNAYNIADKIQSANNRLFGSGQSLAIQTDGENEEIVEEIVSKIDKVKLTSTHRVTFSSDIEEIEDKEIESHENDEGAYYDDNDDQINEEINEILDRNFQTSSSDESIANEEIVERIPGSSQEINIGKIEKKNEILMREKFSERKHSHAATKREFSKKSKLSRTVDSAKHMKKSRTNDDNEMLKIHLNIRKCCESKLKEDSNLPRYIGYLSQYGLSKDQLERREANLRREQQRNEQRRIKRQQTTEHKSEINEQAFKKWLENKQRTTKSKHKNMFNANSNRK